VTGVVTIKYSSRRRDIRSQQIETLLGGHVDLFPFYLDDGYSLLFQTAG
jgi:hypothetical protein